MPNGQHFVVANYHMPCLFDEAVNRPWENNPGVPVPLPAQNSWYWLVVWNIFYFP
jgi:hypothetical protein